MFSLGRVLQGASPVGWQWPGFCGQSWPSRVTWSFAPHQEGSCRAAPAPGELPAARRDPFSQFPWQNKQLSLIMGCHGNCWTSRQFSGVCMCFCRGLRALPAHWLGFRAHHGPRQSILPSATCSLACPCHPAHAGAPLGPSSSRSPQGQGIGAGRDMSHVPGCCPVWTSVPGSFAPWGGLAQAPRCLAVLRPVGARHSPGGTGSAGCGRAGSQPPAGSTVRRTRRVEIEQSLS